MPGVRRNPIDSSRRVGNSHSSSRLPILDLATEKHYSIVEIAELWALSQKTVRRIFENEPGVIAWGHSETMRKRRYRTLCVPETVLQRVHRKLCQLP
jgi:transcriptional regulator GlxA family with amidase domain